MCTDMKFDKRVHMRSKCVQIPFPQSVSPHHAHHFPMWMCAHVYIRVFRHACKHARVPQLQMFPPDFKFPCTVGAPGCATNGVPPAPESKYPESDPKSGAFGLPIGIEGKSKTSLTKQQLLQQVRAHGYTHACTRFDMCVVVYVRMGTDMCFGMCVHMPGK